MYWLTKRLIDMNVSQARYSRSDGLTVQHTSRRGRYKQATNSNAKAHQLKVTVFVGMYFNFNATDSDAHYYFYCNGCDQQQSKTKQDAFVKEDAWKATNTTSCCLLLMIWGVPMKFWIQSNADLSSPWAWYFIFDIVPSGLHMSEMKSFRYESKSQSVDAVGFESMFNWTLLGLWENVDMDIWGPKKWWRAAQKRPLKSLWGWVTTVDRESSHAIVVRLPGDCSVLFTKVEIMVFY